MNFKYEADLEARRGLALRRLRDGGSALVALSGGVDSSVLLLLALEALGAERVLAVTGRSASLAARDLEIARRTALALGVRHEILETRELDRPAYRANAGDRCFHCRSELFELLGDLARRQGLEQVVYGALAEDLGDLRPGMRAAEAFRVRAPLLQAGLTKDDVRQLAARAGLEVHDKPASACLASRIPAGTEVTAERLGQVERAEKALADLGFGQFRVRHHGEVARLELDAEGRRRIVAADLASRVVREVQRAGFRFVTLDLEGYRTGSLNVVGPQTPQRIAPTRESGQ